MSIGNSLRGRLLAAITAAGAVVLIAAGVALYLLVRTSLLQQIDAALLRQAGVMASMFEWKQGRLDLDLEDLTARGKAAPGGRQYFEVWQEGRGLLARSSQAMGPIGSGAARGPVAPSFGYARLPGNGPVRVLSIGVRPRLEGVDGGTPPRGLVPAPQLTLVLAGDLSGYEESLGRLAWLLVAVGLAAMLASAGGAWWAVGYGLRPMQTLAKRISGLDEAGLDQRVDLPTAPMELQSIVRRLNEFLQRLEAAFDREKSLLANLAHELRTPLAGLSFTMEVALSRPREAEDYAADMRQCLAISRQTQAMVDNLLAMARLDAGQAHAPRLCAVDLAEALGRVWAPLEGQAMQKGLTVQWDLAPGLAALADPDGLWVILRNLLANAVDHADRGGRLWVRTSRRQGRAEINIANTGCGLSPRDAERVFERFWRGDASRGGDQAHSGLGLALSRQLAQAMQGTLEADPGPDGRFSVTLGLPMATDGGHAEHHLPDGERQ